jgi:hypothetical protein
MLDLFQIWFGAALRFFRTRQNLMLENLALRQQLVVLKRRNSKPKLGLFDKLFYVALRRLWSDWKKCPYLVAPDTVPRWHRAGFRLNWALLCKVRRRVGGKKIPREVRDLIFQMVAENATWGAPLIHGELRMLGFEVSERTISRWMRRAPRNPEPAQRWRAFLHNHRVAIAAMDFFTLPTLTFRVLYCFFVIEHGRRKILHFNVAEHPAGPWTVQQLREAFLESCPYRYAILDRDGKFGEEVTDFLTATLLARVPQEDVDRVTRELRIDLASPPYETGNIQTSD